MKAADDITVDLMEVNPALADVYSERIRQIEEEGFGPEHDDQHKHGELAMTAAVFCAPEPIYFLGKRHDIHGNAIEYRFIDPFPWSEDWDRRDIDDRRGLLVKAAALIVAEIERIDRKGWIDDAENSPTGA